MGGITTTLDVVREINPARIRADADTPSSVLVVGDPEERRRVAGWLTSGSGLGEDHPWVRQLACVEAVPPADPQRALAVLALRGSQPSPEAHEAARRLREAGVPTLAVFVGDAPQWVGIVPADVSGVQAMAIAADAPAATFASEVVPALLDQTPEVRGAELALARQFPVFRREYARRLVEDTSRANAWYAVSTGVAQLSAVLSLPVALADIVVLSKNQIIMAYKIALAAGREDRPRVLLGEVVGVIGAGLLFRQIARELVGMVPGVGLAPKVAVAYAGTKLVGAVVTAWALEGRKVEMRELRYLYASTLAAGRRLADELQSRARRTEATRADRALPAAGEREI